MSGAIAKSTKKKKSNRLSLSTRQKVTTESPKTPKANALTAEQSSPTEPLCSTPLNTRKRNCTPDDNDSPVLMTFTQDLRRFGTDVTWQWNSPKRHIGEEKTTKEKPSVSRRVASVARPQDSPSPIRPSERLQRTTQLSGFYKFQKELQELELFNKPSSNGGEKKEELWTPDTDTYETAKTSLDTDSLNPLPIRCTNEGAGASSRAGAESPDVFADDSPDLPALNVTVTEPPPVQRARTNLNKSFDDLSKADPPLDTSATKKLNADDSFRKYKSSDNFSLKNQANEYFDDSDFEVDDDVLNKCMEKAKVLSQKPTSAAPAKRSSLAVTCEAMFNDSMDDCFSQFPINEVIAKQQPTNVMIGSPKPTSSASFGRHNSSPQLVKPKPVFQHKQPSRSTTTSVMQRHTSMPPTTITGISSITNTAQPSPSSSSGHSSVESLSMSPKKCTAQEIERKRQQALQRRKAALAKLNFAKAHKR